MQRLTALYADQWNEGYFGLAETFKSTLAEIEAACAEVGRDPETLKKTALLLLAYPDLGAPSDLSDPHLSGSSEEVAAALRDYEALGVDHVMFHLVPHLPEAVERASEAVRLYRGVT